MLEGYGLRGVAGIDAARYLRSLLHGFVGLETVGGFAMARSVEKTFAAAVAALHRSLATWPGRTGS